MIRFNLALISLFTLVSSSQLFAHPGHGKEVANNPHGILHYLTEPVHLMPLAAIGLFVFLFVIGKKFLQRSRNRHQTVIISHEIEKK